jgi:hypothetical protein
MPRLLLFESYYILLLSDTERMAAAKGGVFLLPHQHNLQPSPDGLRCQGHRAILISIAMTETSRLPMAFREPTIAAMWVRTWQPNIPPELAVESASE